MAIFIEICNTLSAFEKCTIGTKVIDHTTFLDGLTKAIEAYKPSPEHTLEQYVIPLPNILFQTVSGGVGKRTSNPTSYILAHHREHVSAYLKREHAAHIKNLTAIVYTRHAYLNDPDVLLDFEEQKRINQSPATHVLVALLSSPTNETSPLSPYRLVHNLAGGNNEAALWSAADIQKKAKESKTYWDIWATVADEPLE